MASGTKSRPIIMTSSLPFGQRARGDWGGLVMLGKAPINVGGTSRAESARRKMQERSRHLSTSKAWAQPTTASTAAPTRTTAAARSATSAWSTPASILSPNNELNSFTWGGCGKGTVAEHLQAIYGKDDSFEWFGGTMDAK